MIKEIRIAPTQAKPIGNGFAVAKIAALLGLVVQDLVDESVIEAVPLSPGLLGNAHRGNLALCQVDAGRVERTQAPGAPGRIK